MPYIPPRKQYDKSQKLLKAYDITSVRLTAILDCSLPTARKKLDDPGKLTTHDWSLICKRGHIPVDEIRLVFLS